MIVVNTPVPIPAARFIDPTDSATVSLFGYKSVVHVERNPKRVLQSVAETLYRIALPPILHILTTRCRTKPHNTWVMAQQIRPTTCFWQKLAAAACAHTLRQQGQTFSAKRAVRFLLTVVRFEWKVLNRLDAATALTFLFLGRRKRSLRASRNDFCLRTAANHFCHTTTVSVFAALVIAVYKCFGASLPNVLDSSKTRTSSYCEPCAECAVIAQP